MRLDISYKEKKNLKKYKHMEIEQYTSKWPTGYWRNQRGNKKNMTTKTEQLKIHMKQ